jgi:hypothetical protein
MIVRFSYLEKSRAMKQITTFDDFVEHALLLRRDGTIQKPDQVFDMSEVLFEPKEIAEIINRADVQPWTYVAEEEKDYIISGFVVVNRLGYMFTLRQSSDTCFDKCRVDGRVIIDIDWAGSE